MCSEAYRSQLVHRKLEDKGALSTIGLPLRTFHIESLSGLRFPLYSEPYGYQLEMPHL